MAKKDRLRRFWLPRGRRRPRAVARPLRKSDAPQAAEGTRDAAQETESAPVAAASSAPAGGKMAPGGKGMSMADNLAAARGEVRRGARGSETCSAEARRSCEAGGCSKPGRRSQQRSLWQNRPRKNLLRPQRLRRIRLAFWQQREKARSPSDDQGRGSSEGRADARREKKIEVPPMPAKPDYARAPVATVVVDTRPGGASLQPRLVCYSVRRWRSVYVVAVDALDVAARFRAVHVSEYSD